MIVSGLAYGIDTAAHVAALKHGLPTVAVMAHGLDTIYPAQNRDLAKQILAHGGSILSEYPTKTRPYRQNFLQRNRIVAGLSELTFVVESMQITVEPKKGEQQLTPQVMSRLFAKPVVSPEYNADGSVTFRVNAPNASKVELECQMFSGTRPMAKDANGAWSITVKPEVPDIYPYAFVIDGTKVADAANMPLRSFTTRL